MGVPERSWGQSCLARFVNTRFLLANLAKSMTLTRVSVSPLQVYYGVQAYAHGQYLKQ